MSFITNFFSKKITEKRTFEEFQEDGRADIDAEQDELAVDIEPQTPNSITARPLALPRKQVPASRKPQAPSQIPLLKSTPVGKPASLARSVTPAQKSSSVVRKPGPARDPAPKRAPLENVPKNSERTNALEPPRKHRRVLRYVLIPAPKRPIKPLDNATTKATTPNISAAIAPRPIVGANIDTDSLSSARPQRRKSGNVSYVAKDIMEISDDSDLEVQQEDTDDESEFEGADDMEIDESSGSEEEAEPSDEDSDVTSEEDIPLARSKSRAKASNVQSMKKLDDGIADEESDIEESNADRKKGRATKQRVVDMSDNASESENVAPKPKSSRKISTKKRVPTFSNKTGLDLNLPPMFDINDIFAHIVKRACGRGFADCVHQLRGRTINVATLCSGTEAPLLALQLINEALAKDNRETLSIKHRFSAEIEPYKQAYIERNFQPDIIFRDVRDLTDKGNPAESAITVYGSEQKIPGDIHIVIAGFACVDRSPLNNYKKKLVEKSETGDTFRAIVSYANVYQPPIIILENIQGKKTEWDEFKELFAKIGYESSSVKVDTKNFYLPQTRVRTYMVCFNIKKFGKGVERAAAAWPGLVKQFERRASSPFADFILPFDDPRLQRLRMAEVREAGERKESTWEKCRARHEKARRVARLGDKRPLTDWIEGGSCNPPDYSDKALLKKRVARDWDYMDITFLRNALPENFSYDSQYKMRIWDVSQNVDRGAERPVFGVSNCLTPSGIGYLTHLGIRATGYEYLLLQGLPIDRVVFTTETNSQLRSLGGNAMTTTAVGCATISALILSFKSLFSQTEADSAATSSTDIVPSEAPTISGTQYLKPCSHQQPSIVKINLADLIEDAKRSASMCICEGNGLSVCPRIQICASCGHTACTSCAGRPLHNYEKEIQAKDRLMPQDFERKWRSTLPSRLAFHLTKNNKTLQKYWADIKSARSEQYRKTVSDAFDTELRLTSFDRKNTWVVHYDSADARLDLVISERPEWRLYAKAPSELPANSAMRSALNHPIARSLIKEDDLLSSSWEILDPRTEKWKVSIQASDETHPSWRNRIGLLDYQDERVPQILTINSPKSGLGDVELSGKYQLLPNCGTAKDNLYKSIQRDSKSDYKPLYLFLDPFLLGNPRDDSFVFSGEHHRLPWGQHRIVVARMDSAWEPWDKRCLTQSNVTVEGQWSNVAAPYIQLVPISTEMSLSSLPESTSWTDSLLPESCFSSSAILACQFEIPKNFEANWDTLKHIQPGDKQFFTSFSIVLDSIRSAQWLSDSWRQLNIDTTLLRCDSCAPKTPGIRWQKQSDDNFKPFEDHIDAATYEKTLKQRPQIFTLGVEADASRRYGEIKVGLNVQSMAHRSLAKLSHASGPPMVSWRLMTDAYPLALGSFPRFRLRNNDTDGFYPTPPGMSPSLRIEQQRELQWMRGQENPDAPAFILQEVEEASVPQLKWRAEVRAHREAVIKGGALCSRVGFGKTVTTLALVHAEFREKGPDTIVAENLSSPNAYPGLINISATLVIASDTVATQWGQEISKFLGNEEYNSTNVLLIKRAADLDRLTIRDFINARVILVNWTVFANESYLSKLADSCAMPEPVTKPSRAFSAWLDYALPRIPGIIESLKNVGLEDFWEELEDLRTDTLSRPEFESVVPSKRLTGRKYAEYSPETARKSKGKSKTKSKPVSAKKRKHETAEWESLVAPVFQFFRFNRIVVDEYPYLEQGTLTSYMSITRLHSEKTWILSGTPGLDDFHDIRVLASFFNVDLGEDTEAAGVITPRNLKKIKAGQTTTTEQFLSFQEARSQEWHEERHRYAQRFLDQFARQNVADIGDIPATEVLRLSRLQSTHHEIYLDLLDHFTSNGMEFCTKLEAHSDHRMSMIKQAQAESKTPEGALVNCSTYFKPAGDAVEIRLLELENSREALRQTLLHAETLKKYCGHLDEHYQEWKTDIEESNHLGDLEVVNIIKALISKAEHGAVGRDLDRPNIRKKAEQKAIADELRELNDDIRKQERSYLAQFRSIRYHKALRKLRNATFSETPEGLCENSHCKRDEHDPLSCVVLPVCGHISCDFCLVGEDEDDVTVCPVEGCKNKTRDGIPISGAHVPQTSKASKSSSGAKLDDLCDLLDSIGNDQAVLFVQNAYILNKVAQELETRNISHWAIRENAPEIGDLITEFQVNTNNSTKKRVLVLDVYGANAAGLNLFNANHVIFLSPLLEVSQHDYESKMEQAIGRVRRYGQEKDVHVHHFVALNTVDVDILERHYRRSDVLLESVPSPMNVDGDAMEHTKLAHNRRGDLMLVPKSQLANSGKASNLHIDLKNTGHYRSLAKFSNDYENLEEDEDY